MRVGAGDHRVGALHEQHLARITAVGGHPPTDLVHRHLTSLRAVQRFGGPAPLGHGRPGANGADHTAASHAEVSAQHGQPQHGSEPCATVLVAFETPPDTQHRRLGGTPPARQRLDVVGIEPGHLACMVQRPHTSVHEVLLDSLGVRRHEVAVEVAVSQPEVRDGIGKRRIGAGPNGQVQIGSRRHRRAARVDHHHLGAVALGLLHEWREVGVAGGGIRSPDHDQATVQHIVGISRVHRTEHRLPPGAGGERTDRGGDHRRADRREDGFSGTVGLHHGGRGVVGVGHHSVGPLGRDGALHPVGDQGQGFVPRGGTELTGTLDPRADERREHTLGGVDALVVATHLRADPAIGEGVVGPCVDVGDASVGHRDRERTRIGAVEGASGVDDAHVGLLGEAHGFSLTDRLIGHKHALRQEFAFTAASSPVGHTVAALVHT